MTHHVTDADRLVFGFLLLILLLAPSSAAAQDARTLLEQFLSKISAVSVNDLAVTQEIVVVDPSGSGQKVSGEQHLYLKPPNKRRLETQLESSRVVTLVNGSRLVMQRDGKAYEAPPGDRMRDWRGPIFLFQRSAQDLLAQWQGHGIRTDVLHQTTHGGRAVTVIGAAPGDQSLPSVWLDPVYGVVRLVTREETPAGLKRIELSLSDFRPMVNGISYPYKQETLLDGQPFSVVSVKSVRVNSGLSDELFDPDRLLRESPR
jgi:hypothetical protein